MDLLEKKYHWVCVFTEYGDKLELYITENNSCATYKQLQRWWRIHHPQYKLKRAILNEEPH